MKTTKKTVKAWAGIVNNALHRDKNEQFGFVAVFRTRRDAKNNYECVTPCTITYKLPVKKKV